MFQVILSQIFNLNSEERFQLSLNDRDLIENMYKYYKLQVQILLWGHCKQKVRYQGADPEGANPSGGVNIQFCQIFQKTA